MFNHNLKKCSATGIEPIDNLIGGHFQGGVHGLLGPTAVGSTTIGTMLAAKGACHQYLLRKQGAPAGPWWFFSSSECPSELWASGLACAASLPLSESQAIVAKTSDRLATLGTSSFNAVSYCPENTDGTLGVVEGPIAMLREMLRVVKVDRLPKKGGAIEVICNLVATNPNATSAVGGIVIDDVFQFVNDFRESRGLPVRTLSSLIKGFVGRCRSTLANVYDCPVWLLHHVAAGKSQLPIHKLDHHDAGETRHFGDFLDVSIVLSEKDRVTGNFSARCTKLPTRRPDHSPLLLRLTDNPWLLQEVIRPVQRCEPLIFIDDETKARVAELAREEEKMRVIDLDGPPKRSSRALYPKGGSRKNTDL
jgi:hypothetical protein